MNAHSPSAEQSITHLKNCRLSIVDCRLKDLDPIENRKSKIGNGSLLSPHMTAARRTILETLSSSMLWGISTRRRRGNTASSSIG